MKRTLDIDGSQIRRADQGVCEVDCIDGFAVAAARATLPAEERITALAEGMRVLANPARLRLALALADRELCVCDCASLLGQSLSAASQHLKALRRIGAVVFRQDGKLAYYRLTEGRWRRQIVRMLDDLTRPEVAA